jgi:tricorn protease-like protein
MIVKVAIAVMVIAITVNGTSEGGRPDNNPSPKKARIGSLPPTAEILFVSNRDTGTRRYEIYAMDADGGNVTRLTFTKDHHTIMGLDRSRRYLVTSRAVKDTHKPIGLGGEDRRSIWLLDLETKKESRLTNPLFHSEGDSFSPDGEWIVFFMKLYDDDQLDIYKIRRDGSDLTRLTDTLMALEGDPSLSNDGTRIAFTYLDALDPNPRFILKTMDVRRGYTNCL